MEVDIGMQQLYFLCLALIIGLVWRKRQFTSPQQNLRSRRPFDVLYDPEKEAEDALPAKIDIIAVHGLGSNVDRTWTWNNEHEPSQSVNWLKDVNMLRSKIPTARIMVFNYDSTWLSDAPKTRVELCGEELIRSLHNFRQEHDRPIVFVAHSFGGLVVQDALLFAYQEKDFQKILQSTAGFVPLGTPFRGTSIRWAANMMANIMRFAGSHGDTLSLLVYDNNKLRDKTHNLGRLRKHFPFPIFCFFELNRTTFIRLPLLSSLFRGMVVEEGSACISGDGRLQLQTDHINLNKYSGPQDRAFLSVSAEIVKMCKDASSVTKKENSEPTLSHISHSIKQHWLVPFERNEGFVGREDILRDLLKRIPPVSNRDICQRTVVEGLGGIGKTQIVLEAAFRMRILHPDCSVFWVPAIDTISFESAFHDVANCLGIQKTEGGSTNLTSRVQTALSNENAGQWLLIVDNADDPALMFESGQLVSHLPSSPLGSILFTTRTSEVTSRLDVLAAGIFSIDAMRRQESMNLMNTRLSTSQMEDAKSLDALLEVLEDLPLAVKQAAAYMQKTGTTPARYLYHCQSSNASLVKLLSRGLEDRTQYSGVKNPVAKTWLISFDQISTSSPLAGEYLRFMCFLSEKNIPLSALPPGNDEIEVDEAVGILQAYALITAREDRQFVDMHRLVRLTMRNWLDEKGDSKETYEIVLGRMGSLIRRADEGNRGEWTKYMTHAQSVVDDNAKSSDPKATHRLLRRFAAALTLQGMYEPALDMLLRAQEVGIGIYKDDDATALATRENLASTLARLGRYHEAADMTRQTLRLKERAFGKEHQTTVRSRAHLATTLHKLGRDKEAEQVSRQTLQIEERIFGREHPDTLLSMNNLAAMMYQQHRYHEAEEILRQVIQAQKRALGQQHPDTLGSQNNLAATLSRLNQYQEAEELSRQVVQIEKRTLGKEHPRTLNSVNTLAVILCRIGRFLEGEQMQRSTLQVQERLFGTEHPETVAYKHDLGYCLYKAAKFQDALEILQDTVDLRSKVLGKEHPQTKESMELLGLIQRQLH